MRHKVIFSLGIFCALFYSTNAKTERVICYYGSWAAYRGGNGRYLAEDIDATLCTHIIYTFLGIEPDGNLRILDPGLELNNRNLLRFNALKQKNPKLKTSVAVGGWKEGSEKYSAVAADPAKRATLIRSAVNFLETYGFDGFDLDWEYPGQRGGAYDDKRNYVTLLKEFREVFDRKGFILTAAVAAGSYSVDLSYDVPALSKYLDSINVMTYDLHGVYDGVTGANAPLYPSDVDLSPNAKALTVDACIKGWLARGADPQKISMGIPMYGRTFTLTNSNSRKIGAPVSYAGNAGPYTGEAGMLGFLEICEMQKQGGWEVIWDNSTKTPYAIKNNQWISYDNEESIRLKVEYAKSLNLGGVMLWSLETADFRGICGNKYPILNGIRKTLDDDPNPQPKPDDSDDSKKDSSNESSKSDSSGEDSKDSGNDSKESGDDSKDSGDDSKESGSDSKDSGDDSNDSGDDSQESGNVCKEAGMSRDPKDCSVFYVCVPNGIKLEAVKFSCSPGLVFDSKVNVCNYKELVDCKK